MGKTPVVFLILCFLLVSCAGEKAIPSPLAPALAEPTASPTPFSPPTPAYSYLPVITEANATQVANLDRADGGVSSLAFSPNGKYLAAAFDNGAGLIWDISRVKYWYPDWSSSPKDTFLAGSSVSFNPDGSVLATGGTLLELPSKVKMQELPGTAIISPTGSSLALFDDDTISVWKPDGTEWGLDYKQSLRGTVSTVFSEDGSLLAEALDWGAGEGVNIWRVSDHKLLYNLAPPEHSHPAHFNFHTFAFAAFSPDGHFAATGTRDFAAVRIWDLRTGSLIKELATAVETQPGGWYVPNVDCVTFTQDSKVLVIVAADTLIFKKASDGGYMGMLQMHPYAIPNAKSATACAASHDGKLLAVGDSGGEVSIWGIPASAP